MNDKELLARLPLAHLPTCATMYVGNKCNCDIGKIAVKLITSHTQQIALEARYLAEVWKVVEDYPSYEVSSAGRVRRDGKFIKSVASTRGYLRVSLSKDGKPKGFFVHRLVAKAFIKNPENKPQVNHIDGDPGNNFISNLEWVTAQENERHAFDVLGKKVWNKDTRQILLANCDYCGRSFSHRSFHKAKYCSVSCSSKKHWGEKREQAQEKE
jgi:hypothetical protein